MKIILEGLNCKFKNNGSRTTAVLVHGYNSSKEVFDDLFKKENNFNLLSIDYAKGFEKINESGLSLEEMAMRVEKVIKKINTKIVLVGHSFGGAVISEIKNSFKIKGYVFISSFTKSVVHSSLHKTLISITNKKVPKAILSSLVIAASKKMKFDLKWSLDFLSPKPEFKHVYKNNILNINYINTRLNETIGGIKKPIYAIIGTRDKVIPVDSYKEYFNTLGVEVKLLKKSGHNPLNNSSSEINLFLNENIKLQKKWKKIKLN